MEFDFIQENGDKIVFDIRKSLKHDPCLWIEIWNPPYVSWYVSWCLEIRAHQVEWGQSGGSVLSNEAKDYINRIIKLLAFA